MHGQTVSFVILVDKILGYIWECLLPNKQKQTNKKTELRERRSTSGAERLSLHTIRNGTKKHLRMHPCSFVFVLIVLQHALCTICSQELQQSQKALCYVSQEADD